MDVGSLLEWDCDSIIMAEAAATAYTVLVETGAGTVIGYSIATFTITEDVERIGKAILKIQTAWTVIFPIFQSPKTAEQV